MTVRKKKKIRKQRASRTYGYGRISGGHRKGGSRGGVGNAGSKGHHRIGRIADMIQSQKGFTTPNPSIIHSINIGEIDEQLEFLLAAEVAEKRGSIFKVDVGKIGYKKVLGKGLVNNSLHIYTQHISPKAQEKIEAAGGKVFLEKSSED